MSTTKPKWRIARIEKVGARQIGNMWQATLETTADDKRFQSVRFTFKSAEDPKYHDELSVYRAVQLEIDSGYYDYESTGGLRYDY